MISACCLPITFVGPARVESTNAILSFLCDFPEISILACSITCLDDLAFIHLQLAVKQAHPSRLDALNAGVDRRIRAGASSLQRHLDASPPADVSTRIIPVLLNRDTVEVRDQARGHLLDRAGNYQTLVGPVRRILPAKEEKRQPVWVSWQTA